MPGTRHFQYGDEEIHWLKSRDPILGAAMDEIGRIRRAVIPDLFTALANAIVGQQISTKAQETVWKRMVERFSPITPQGIAATAVEELQACGISMRKAFYIKEAAQSAASGSLDLTRLSAMPDNEICTCLSRHKGVGVWTAEMLMTFSMQRPDNRLPLADGNPEMRRAEHRITLQQIVWTHPDFQQFLEGSAKYPIFTFFVDVIMHIFNCK